MPPKKAAKAASRNKRTTVINAEANQEEDQRQKIEAENRLNSRLEASMTFTGLRDWLFNAAPLVRELAELVSPEVGGFRNLQTVIADAGMNLNDEQWESFTTIPFRRTHNQDQEVHTGLFTKYEPSWKQVMLMPKTGKVCTFLFIGTDPPTDALLRLFSRLGWFGVSIAKGTTPGFGDCVASYVMDPGAHRDDWEFQKLLQKAGGIVPKPTTFPLCYVNLVFDMGTVEPDSEEDDELEPELAEKVKRELGSLPPTPASFTQQSKPPDLVEGGGGYGLLGATRTSHVRRRLRAVRNCIAVGLQRLANQGTFVVVWPGLPYHPILLFVVSYMRSLFQRVHLLVQEDSAKTFEIYILGICFNREDAIDGGAIGSMASVFKSFIESSFRRNGLDDVLLWTLTNQKLVEEARFGCGGQSLQQSYDDLWNNYTKKLEALRCELGADAMSFPTTVAEPRPKAKAKAEPASQPPASAKDKKVELKAKAQPDASKRGVDRKADDSSDEGELPKASPRPEDGFMKSPRPDCKGKGPSPSDALDDKKNKGVAHADAPDDTKLPPVKGAAPSDKNDAPVTSTRPPVETPSGKLDAASDTHEAHGKHVKHGKDHAKGKDGKKHVKHGEGGHHAKVKNANNVQSDEKRDGSHEKPVEPSGEPRGEPSCDQDVDETVGEDGANLFVSEDAAEVKTKPRRNKLVLTRSLPALCGSLGAAPGSDFRTGPDVHAMARKWPMLRHGWKWAEDAAILAFEPEDTKKKKG
jgi:hypothetical protein